MKILNLTQHAGTPEQGVIEPMEKMKVQELLTFHTCPTAGEISHRARELAEIAYYAQVTHAMIGGAPYLMSALEAELMDRHIKPLYSFSVRCSEDQVQADGSVRKVAVFKHVEWVKVYEERNHP